MFALVINCLLLIHACAKQLVSNRFSGRAAQSLPVRRPNLNSALLGKPSHLTISSRARARPLLTLATALRGHYSSSTACHKPLFTNRSGTKPIGGSFEQTLASVARPSRRAVLVALAAISQPISPAAKADLGDGLADVLTASGRLPSGYEADFKRFMELAKEIEDSKDQWGSETYKERQRAFLEVYIRVFDPVVAYAATVSGLDLAAVTFFVVALNLSGVGFQSLKELMSDVPLIGPAINATDPTLGNIALALALNEFTAPVLLPLGAKFTPAVREALETKIVDWGLDADSIMEKLYS
eukprot:gnl/TRDRNA2_/TRDRNA2_39074_c0_seq1.p1 gnl/TRDRNA2_/TRDRNA2_39074_c0~~gnl/TRDRNA2_/TRDRNA2_39074_c0_seq1.p1  ORF type:complete len:298 (-),score=42.46 gnl/TRDRNA2_/TRDRNA2_39074_c0_seq1:216-1109(-)